MHGRGAFFTEPITGKYIKIIGKIRKGEIMNVTLYRNHDLKNEMKKKKCRYQRDTFFYGNKQKQTKKNDTITRPIIKMEGKNRTRQLNENYSHMQKKKLRDNLTGNHNKFKRKKKNHGIILRQRAEKKIHNSLRINGHCNYLEIKYNGEKCAIV